MKRYYVYILTNKRYGVFYVGFTDDIQRRMHEHKNKIFKGFTKKYNVDRLVYYESFLSFEDAQIREKRLKRWERKRKIQLIEEMNPDWNDLSKDFGKILTPIEKMDLLLGWAKK